jgi:hypothetical protein
MGETSFPARRSLARQSVACPISPYRLRKKRQRHALASEATTPCPMFLGHDSRCAPVTMASIKPSVTMGARFHRQHGLVEARSHRFQRPEARIAARRDCHFFSSAPVTRVTARKGVEGWEQTGEAGVGRWSPFSRTEISQTPTNQTKTTL